VAIWICPVAALAACAVVVLAAGQPLIGDHLGDPGPV
jgi:hypothetical protein